MAISRAAASVLLLSLVGVNAAQQAPALPDGATIDAAVSTLMKRERVQGLAVAVIDGGAVRYVAAYGARNAERKLPLTTDTVMYGASLTKAAFSYMVLQLVDEGTLSLDATLPTLLPRPLPAYPDYTDLAGDDRWRALTPRILMTHRTGFANFRWLEPDKRLRFHHDPGARYGYSGEGFYILQLILEEHLHLDVGKEMQRRVFDRFAMRRTSMSWRPDFAQNLADGYGLDGAMEPHDERSSASAAGSMDTTIDDQARLWAAIIRGDGLSAASRAEFVRAQAPITSAHQFPTLDAAIDPGNRAINLAAGLGVVTFQGPQGPAWFKGGHNDWTGNMVICLDRAKRCLVMLANDSRAERFFPDLAEAILGNTGMPWHWEYDWLKTAAAVGGSASERWTEPGTGMVFTQIKAGEFTMGSPSTEPGREEQERQHRVRISRSFWLGVSEVTQYEWQVVMGNNPSHFRAGGDRLPVENVTWLEVGDFLTRLTKRSPGNTFRLPTEAEWEYSCRAGTTTAYDAGESLSHAQANFAETVADSAQGKGQTTTVGSFAPNAWGLFDMHGNVWEWTQDEYCPYPHGQSTDPVASCRAPVKVIRGGSWYYAADSARCALRYTHRPQDRGFSLGFRVVRTAGI